MSVSCALVTHARLDNARDLQVRVDRGEAGERLAEHRWREAKADRRRRGVVDPDLGKHQRDVVHLVTPEIHVRVGVEHPGTGANHVLVIAWRPRQADTRRQIILVDVDESFGIAVLAPDERDRRTLAEVEVRQDLADVVQRRLDLVAQSGIDGERGRHPPVVLQEHRVRHLPHDHRWRAGLPLREGRCAEQEARERVAGAVEQRRATRDRSGELEVAAVLKKPEHVPVELARVAAELDRVMAGAPRHTLTDLKVVVPVPGMACTGGNRRWDRIPGCRRAGGHRRLRHRIRRRGSRVHRCGSCRWPIRRTDACACARNRSGSRSTAGSMSDAATWSSGCARGCRGMRRSRGDSEA